jgi:hypothetical protein
VTGEEYPHLPFEGRIPWHEFPEVSEEALMNEGRPALEKLFQTFDKPKKEQLYSIMSQVRTGWIYGWGDPVTSNKLGDAAIYIWDSFVAALEKKNNNQSLQ